MKRLIPIFLVLFLCFSVSAIQITEVEINPPGSDSGQEWIELYLNEETNLSEYSLVNNDGGTINLSGTYSGYYVFEFSSQWLDNSDEKVFLYKDTELIDETDLLEDSDNDDKTWQVCNGEWIFKESTKEQENICSSSDPPTNQTNSTTNTSTSTPPPSQDQDQDEPEEDIEAEDLPINFPAPPQAIEEIETIHLNSNAPEIKDPKTLNNKNYSSYYLISFCFLLIFLYLLSQRKKIKPKKNEFN